jgi:hypothetical protein
VTYPGIRDNTAKVVLIPDTSLPQGRGKVGLSKKLMFRDGLASYQLVGRVTAYQGDDG